LLGVVATVAAVPAVPAAAASCQVMTVRYDVSGAGLVILDPDHYDVPYGGCVQFVNQTAATTTITVSPGYSEQLGPNENTAGATNYRGTTPGHHDVTAMSGPSAADGSLTVAAPPSHSPTPSPSAAPTRTAMPSAGPPSTSPPSSGGSGPQVAPTPTRTRTHGHGRGGLQPPVSPPGPIQIPTLSPTPTPTPAPTAVLSGRVEPASDRAVGLPAAVAALVLVGTGTAFLRVLTAEPVDSEENVGRRL